jgi:hypothetical protein
MNQRPESLTVRVDGSHFSLAAAGGDSLVFDATGSALSLVWTAANRSPVNIVSTHTDAPIAEGIFPLSLGGSWLFTGSGSGSSTQCQATIGTPQLVASCTGTYDFPEPLPNSLNGTIIGTRMKTLTSVFGDLGGQWHLTGSGGGTCDAVFQGNTLSVTCANADSFTGQASITFCEGVASGSTSDGVEFSALRL